MELEIVKTSDGSDTLFSERFGQHYHSTFGAVAESEHVFIRNGFLTLLADFDRLFRGETIHLLEVGFGTGLNALLTLKESSGFPVRVFYHAIEPYPPERKVIESLNYTVHSELQAHVVPFRRMHEALEMESTAITDHFSIIKYGICLEEYQPEPGCLHIIYFDAFSPDCQPELWTAAIFGKLFRALKPGGILTTYSVKGIVVRALREAGFITEKLPGPPGKRHILRAIKPVTDPVV